MQTTGPLRELALDWHRVVLRALVLDGSKWRLDVEIVRAEQGGLTAAYRDYRLGFALDRGFFWTLQGGSARGFPTPEAVVLALLDGVPVPPGAEEQGDELFRRARRRSPLRGIDE